jgi:hypothetical protein
MGNIYLGEMSAVALSLSVSANAADLPARAYPTTPVMVVRLNYHLNGLGGPVVARY